MKTNTPIFALALFLLVSPVSLRADDAPVDIVKGSSRLGRVMPEYDKRIRVIEDERNKAVSILNGQLLGELAKAKSEALKEEKLTLAVAIDAKIKEVTEQTDMVKAALAAPLNTNSSSSSSSVEYKRMAKKIMDWVAKSKLTDEQKATLKDFVAGKIVAKNPFGGFDWFDKDGNLWTRNRDGIQMKREVGTTKIDKQGTMSTDGENDFYFDKMTEKNLPMRWQWMKYTRTFVPYETVADEIEKGGSAAKSKDGDTGGKGENPFGRRVAK